MISLLDEQAIREGSPLTPVDKQLLRCEFVEDFAPPQEFYARMIGLTKKLLAYEAETGTPESPKSFLATLEWAADDPGHPYVVKLTASVLRDRKKAR